MSPARVAQGGVVAVLVAGLCTTVTGQAAASSDVGRTAAVAEARADAVDVATAALVAVEEVQRHAAATGLGAGQLTALRRAAAHVDALIAKAEQDGDRARSSAASKAKASAEPTQDPTSADAGTEATGSSAQTTPGATDEPSVSATDQPSAQATDQPTVAAADVPTAGATDEPADGAADVLAADVPLAISTPLASDPSLTPADETAASVTDGEKTAPPAPADEVASGDEGSDEASDDEGSGDAAQDVPLDEVEVDVPTIPDTGGPEDETTEELRAAVATLATIADLVQDAAAEQAEAEAEKAAQEQAAADAKEAAEAKKAADAKKAKEAKKAKAAAEKKAANAKAKQRAAWKKSLQGYPNGRIPAKALCGVSFDDDVRLRCDAAEALDALDDAYTKRFGYHLKVSDSYRSYSAQIACRKTKGYLCAVPGTSNHGWGVAVDLGGGIQSFGTVTHRWMVANAAKYGWKHPAWAGAGGSKPEAWHWEYVG